ncbi:MAG: (5-formylfuran-3-yl)methyl phosphate synthase [Hyphomicrobiales bacterium]
MTRLLASVRDPAEAETALRAGADIIDLKDPARGALGAVDPATLMACVAAMDGRVPVSATIGDLPMDADAVETAVLATAACGVDYVKFGIFPGGDPRGCLARVGASAPSVDVILVLFADAMPAFDAVAAAAEMGARGVMLDTADKAHGSLLDHMTIEDIGRFVETARARDLLAGVAGALRPAHVAPLLAVRPDVIGFRGALCRDGERDGGIDPLAVSRIRALIPQEIGLPEAQMQAPDTATVC